MTKLTPKAMLTLYQQHSSEELTNQIEMALSDLSAKDMARLLAYQIGHLTMASQMRDRQAAVSIDEAQDELGGGHA